MKQIRKIKEELKKIGLKRNSAAFLYITGGTKFGASIALDSLYLIKNVLEGFARTKDQKITLILRTLGGHTNAPWPIINLIREYCKEFEIIVLDKALSGRDTDMFSADRIIMPPFSYLSPVDPRQIFQEGNSQKFIEVEDIVNYFDFGKERLKLDRKNMVEMVKELNKEILPTRLGSIHRTHTLIKDISEKSLSLHNKEIKNRQKRKIVEKLTSKLYSHDHFINRNEARENIGFGEIIEFADLNLENLIEKISKPIYNLVDFRRKDEESKVYQETLKNTKEEYEAYTGLIVSLEKGFLFKNKIKKLNIQQPNTLNITPTPQFDIFSDWEEI